jgi:hypothetical protein
VQRDGRLKTLNVYVPPAFRKDGDELRAAASDGSYRHTSRMIAAIRFVRVSTIIKSSPAKYRV